MTLPPEPRNGPLMQTLRWTIRPLAFMDECRRRLGPSFSLRFLGFERPMVLISDPAAIKALYMEQANELPPGRNIVLEPILGSQSLLLQEGAEHLARRRLMLPAFHGERMRSYEAVLDEIVSAEIDSWPLHAEFPIHTRMQAITLEAILRIVFGVADGPRLERLRGVLSTVLTETASPRAQLVALATRRLRGGNAFARFEGQLKEVDELLYAEIAEHRTRPDLAEREDILSMLMLAEFEDGGDDERQGAARPADDPAAGRPRDDGDGARLELRPAAAPPASRCGSCATRCRRGRTSTCGRRSPSRCACAPCCRWPVAASPRSSRSTASPCRRAPT